VGFRYCATREAERLGITGWIMNEDDGSVSVLAEGGEKALDAFALWLESGPPGAFIESFDLHPQAPTGYYSGFSVEF
jgi:acylphosphatase